ncbi:hypothetical protein B0H11DRAFT_2241835 [Mycena galericulata]|nr:hypothetical protein B0H11DRAFT_2241835 [Mycena galericulata]
MSFQVGQLTIPLFVGTVMNWTLLGALAVQVYLYFLAFPKDRRTSKFLVAFIVVAEILQTLGDSRDTMRIFGAGWGNDPLLDEVGWAWFSVPILGSLIAAVGQLFFAWRIYILGNRTLFIPAVIVIITTIQLGAGIWTGVLICRAGRFSALEFQYLRPPVAWLAATALSDVVIVAGTAFYVMKARQPGFRHTRALVTRIVKVTVETGLACALFALVDLSIFIKYNGNNYHLGVCIWLSKVYSNSIMLILNSRAYIGHEAVAGSRNPSHTTDLVFQSSAPTLRVTTERRITIGSVFDDEREKHGEVLAVLSPSKAHIVKLFEWSWDSVAAVHLLSWSCWVWIRPTQQIPFGRSAIGFLIINNDGSTSTNAQWKTPLPQGIYCDVTIADPTVCTRPSYAVSSAGTFPPLSPPMMPWPSFRSASFRLPVSRKRRVVALLHIEQFCGQELSSSKYFRGTSAQARGLNLANGQLDTCHGPSSHTNDYQQHQRRYCSSGRCYRRRSIVIRRDGYLRRISINSFWRSNQACTYVPCSWAPASAIALTNKNSVWSARWCFRPTLSSIIRVKSGVVTWEVGPE